MTQICSVLLLFKSNIKCLQKGLDQCVCAKTTFFGKFWIIFLTFLLFSAVWHEKHWKSRFWPALGVRSTQMLVKIYKTMLGEYPSTSTSLFHPRRTIKYDVKLTKNHSLTLCTESFFTKSGKKVVQNAVEGTSFFFYSWIIFS